MRAEAAIQQATADYHKLKKKHTKLKADRSEATVDEKKEKNQDAKVYELQKHV